MTIHMKRYGGEMSESDRHSGMRPLFALGAALFFALAFTTSPSHANGQPELAAQNYPLAYFAQRLVADDAEVWTPSPADADPADWAPDISDIERLQNADLILLNGKSYADWATQVALPRSRLVDTTAAIRDRLIEEAGETHKHGPEGAHSHGETALHTWLDFGLAAEQAAAIKARLGRLDGVDASEIDKRWTALAGDLEALDQEARALGEALEGVTLITSHPIYQYFERAYEIDVASVHWEYDEEILAAQWAELDAILAERANAIFVWEGPPLEDSEAGLKERGVSSAVFDPAYIQRDGDFLAIMRANFDRVLQAVGKGR